MSDRPSVNKQNSNMWTSIDPWERHLHTCLTFLVASGSFLGETLKWCKLSSKHLRVKKQVSFALIWNTWLKTKCNFAAVSGVPWFIFSPKTWWSGIMIMLRKIYFPKMCTETVKTMFFVAIHGCQVGVLSAEASHTHRCWVICNRPSPICVMSLKLCISIGPFD